MPSNNVFPCSGSPSLHSSWANLEMVSGSDKQTDCSFVSFRLVEETTYACAFLDSVDFEEGASELVLRPPLQVCSPNNIRTLELYPNFLHVRSNCSSEFYNKHGAMSGTLCARRKYYYFIYLVLPGLSRIKAILE